MSAEFNEWFRARPAAIPLPALGWRQWARRLLVCNPFFLGSAALLLLAVYRLSVEPNFLAAEHTKLLFNYAALQLYELLVVVTAVVLARRKIWYDSALLVVVEHGLLFVPFMLISQGSLISPVLGVALAAGGALLAAGRMEIIRRGYPLFNLPPGALRLGTMFLVFNAALPALFRAQIDEGQERWATPNFWLWSAALPLLVLGANLLPRPTRYGGLNPERHWLPLFLYALWTMATGAHFWCLAYISEQPFPVHALGPAAVAAAWTLWRRIPDCVPQPGARWEMAMLVLTFAAPLVSLGQPALFQSLVLLNALIYIVLLLRRSGPLTKCLRELLLGSAALLVLGVPEEFARDWITNFNRARAAQLAIGFYVGIQAWRSRRMAVGFGGACGAAIFAGLLWPDAPSHAIVEAFAIFLLAHSLTWQRTDAIAAFLQTVAGMAWIADALVWVHIAGWKIDVGISGAGLALALAWLVVSRWRGQWRDWIVPGSALGIVFVAPADWLFRTGSPGLMALAASFTAFAIGVGVAWTRHAWDGIRGMSR